SSKDIQERFVKAIHYFSEQTKTTISEPLKTLGFTTDNKAIEKDINKQQDTIEELLAAKLLYFQGLEKGFNVNTFLELRAKSVFLAKEKPKKPRKSIIDGTTNIELFELLRVLRNNIATENDLIHYQVFTQKALYEICETLPTNKKELLQVNGMGKTRVEKYGAKILKVIHAYCEENDIEISNSEDLFEVEKPKKKRGDTKKESLELFKAGKSIDEIANQRELNPTTVTGHLAYFIPTGEVKITDLISEVHYKELKALIPKYKFENLSDLKHQLDDKYSYGELRLVLEDLKS
ncbi:helix-turn-helix domain-containing protein, partial [uncultured Wocania sp.]|uniref:helix-turn-helix domain-containing protein n=1 Tax=uncultured Wocania sp. TaxID=2834404 RepID=UPI0030FC5DC0